MTENRILTEADMQNMSQDEMLSVFAEQLLRASGREATEVLKADLVAQINGRITDEILKGMSDEKVNELNSLLDNPNTTDEQIDTLIESANVDIESAVKRVMEDFQSEFLKGAKNENTNFDSTR